MDIVIVESYQANILNKIKKENIFSNNISVYTIRDLRKNFS
jgi:hypothetical protein